ncbi:ABC transporter permease [Peptoniphilus obesi]|uniref:ABC transporter permease n=1 Tax=Peptoniphilus obesi TaxID=1472765 RepID=UPI0004B36427|nr:ABC transporter permease [Peptoniphilus obesi]
MGILENIKIAFSGLLLNKMRSFLTMLGIIIGISSVIAIVTIGKALSDSVEQGFSQIGNTTIEVMVRPKDDFEDMTSDDMIPRSEIERFKELNPDKIDSVTINGSIVSGTIKDERKTSNVRIYSTTPGAKSVFSIKMLSGSFLTDEDEEKSKEVAVISDKVVEDIFNDKIEDALGSEIEVDTGGSLRVYRVIGIYKYEPMSMGVFGGESEDDPTSVYIPLGVGNMQFSDGEDTDKYMYFMLSAKDREGLSDLEKEIEKFFNEGILRDRENVEVRANSVESFASQVNQTMGTIKLAIGGIAAISLLVGGIGVMNILLVSVTERTREIGIRKALGATNKDIRLQFIIESIIICIIGGVIGILLGTALGYGASILLKSKTLPSISSIIVAVGFSMAIGIFFGYYPANKAAKLDPIDALRYE